MEQGQSADGLADAFADPKDTTEWRQWQQLGKLLAAESDYEIGRPVYLPAQPAVRRQSSPAR
jgi:hypothetical protein